MQNELNLRWYHPQIRLATLLLITCFSYAACDKEKPCDTLPSFSHGFEYDYSGKWVFYKSGTFDPDPIDTVNFAKGNDPYEYVLTGYRSSASEIKLYLYNSQSHPFVFGSLQSGFLSDLDFLQPNQYHFIHIDLSNRADSAHATIRNSICNQLELKTKEMKKL